MPALVGGVFRITKKSILYTININHLCALRFKTAELNPNLIKISQNLLQTIDVIAKLHPE
jgi:hypothetical protein